jgi:hypothetical protein
MTSHRTFRRIIGFATGTLLGAAALAVALAAVPAADAAQTTKYGQSAKHKKHAKRPAASATAASRPGYWGQNLVPAGPLYNGPDYLGDDPDPNIRTQIIRDLTGRYGGID